MMQAIQGYLRGDGYQASEKITAELNQWEMITIVDEYMEPAAFPRSTLTRA